MDGRGGWRGFRATLAQRKFRLLDDDGSKGLSYAEFKKGLAELGLLEGLGLRDADARLVFAHFDADHSGVVNFDEFVAALRDPLSARRKALVGQAFARLDKDGSGVIEPGEIAQAYDASQHPDVLSGRKTAADVLAEFAENFEVGGTHDGKVTRAEFEAYYENLGANIDDDDYFELMMRNAWHISGGEGWCANTANRRVLVTHADGRQTVEEIHDDLGLQPDDKAGMLARLRAQGVSAADVSTFDGGDDGAGGTAARGALKHFADVREHMAAGMAQGRAAQAAEKPSRAGHDIGVHLMRAPDTFKSSISFAADDEAGGGGAASAQHARKARGAGAQDHFASHLGAGTFMEDVISQAPVVGGPARRAQDGAGGARSLAVASAKGSVTALVERLRAELATRGARGIVGLGRKFRIIDDDGRCVRAARRVGGNGASG